MWVWAGPGTWGKTDYLSDSHRQELEVKQGVRGLRRPDNLADLSIGNMKIL